MPDRLSELLQQRRLIEEHLAWLNREIAAATPSPAATGLSSPPPRQAGSPPVAAAPSRSLPPGGITLDPTASPAISVPSVALTGSTEASLDAGLKEADTILAEYQTDPRNLHVDVKRGCLLYFAAAMGLLILFVALLYIQSVRRHREDAPPAPAHGKEHR